MTTLEKIRAEMVEKWNDPCAKEHGCLDEVLEIINKYASEECDNDCEHCAYLECPKDDYQTDMDEAWEQAKQEEYDKAYDDYLALVNAEQGMQSKE